MRKGRDCIRWELLRARPTGYDEPREHQQGYAAYSLKENGHLPVLKKFYHGFFFLFIAGGGLCSFLGDTSTRSPHFLSRGVP